MFNMSTCVWPFERSHFRVFDNTNGLLLQCLDDKVIDSCHKTRWTNAGNIFQVNEMKKLSAVINEIE
ncbi:hypothetical protein T10_752 [Trichinella papuae]|uniref:Uncharacterized protein n=1 Tax=Trichinella papuae TaxID=268474 RepID=A0A0V1N9Z8_9BILA|nr:hypothetical protein T10_752 [Trichinella papuae]